MQHAATLPNLVGQGQAYRREADSTAGNSNVMQFIIPKMTSAVADDSIVKVKVVYSCVCVKGSGLHLVFKQSLFCCFRFLCNVWF